MLYKFKHLLAALTLSITHTGTCMAIEIGSEEAAQFTADLASGTLPVVYINTEGAAPVIDRENKIQASMWIEIPEGCTAEFEAVGSASEPLALTIKGRGNSSWTNSEKKPYKLKLDKKTELLGMPKHKHWALLALALGHPAQFVNTTGFALGRELGMAWVPRSRHVEVVLNGEYIGLYDLTESVKIGSNRVDIFEQDEENEDEATIPYGWLVEIDNYSDEFQVVVPEHDNKMMRVTHKSPEVLSEAQRTWLTDEFTRLNRIIHSPNPNTAEEWAKHIDVESMVKYFIVRELLQDYDGYNGSFYLHRDAPAADDATEPLWTVGPLWDMCFSGDLEKECWAFEDTRQSGRVHWIHEIAKTATFRDVFDEVWGAFYPEGIKNAIAVLEREGQLCSAAERANNLRWPEISEKTNEKIAILKTAITNNGQWIEDFREDLGAPACEKLTGTPIGTSEGFNYESFSVEHDIQGRAFDGDFNTYFATNQRSYTWVGLDLGEPYIISKVGWAPRNDPDGYGERRVQLGVIQGANSPDWLDAVPIYMITEKGTNGEMSYADTYSSRGFRYVRFVSTGDSRCNIAELEFYGIPGEGDDSNLFQVTNIPTVIINTLDAEEPYDKEHNISSNIIIIDDNKADVDNPGTVRERGNYSRVFPKKPWRIKFDKKQNVLDAPAKAKKWTLINNYGDKTLMRNLVAFEIARRMDMPYVPWSRPVDVILNGEYKGCYQLSDQIEVNESRLEITEMGPEDIEGDALTGGYFFEIDAYAYDEPEGSWFTTKGRNMPVTIKSPDDGGTPEQLAYIRDYLSDIESMITNRKFGKDGGEDYRDVFDVPSFVKHFIVNELAGNTDTYWSTYMYKDRLDPVVYTGPVWDFDIAFENDWRTYPIHHLSAMYLYRYSEASAAKGMKEFATGVLINDSRTKHDITRIWSEARNNGYLSSESLNKYIDSLAEMIDRSQQLNFVRWPILDECVHENPRALGSFEAEIEAVKKYLDTRFSDLDRLFAYDPESGLSTTEPAGSRLRPTVADGAVTLEGDEPFSVFAIDGRAVFTGTGTTGQLPLGIYIVRQGDKAAKVRVR